MRAGAYARRSIAGPVRRRLITDVRPAASKPTASAASVAGAKVRPVQPKPAKRTASTRSPFLPHTSRTQVLQRQYVKKPSGAKRRRSFKKGLLPALAVALFVFGAGVGVYGLRSNHKVEAQVQHLAQQQSTDQAASGSAETGSGTVPSETPANNLAGYKVAATAPRIIRIDSIGVAARVLRTGVNTKNQLGAPANIFDTAWYDGSARPGEAGAVLIDGHVSGPTQNGVFYKLKQLKKGSKITLERGDGKIFSYTVVDMRVYDADKVDMAAALTPITPGKPGLNLITCTGKVASSGTDFVQRLVVFTTQN